MSDQTVKFKSDAEKELWFHIVTTALPLRNDGNVRRAIETADSVLLAMNERRPDENLPRYLAEKVSVTLQQLPTDLGDAWTGKRPEDLAAHQAMLADVIAEALQAPIAVPEKQCTCPRDEHGLMINVNPNCPRIRRSDAMAIRAHREADSPE